MAVDARLTIEESGSPRTLTIEDLLTLPDGAASEDTLELIRLLLAGTLKVDVQDSSLVIDLPAGISTAARQDTGNTTLASILSALGPKVAASDLSELATTAKQDTQSGKLDALLTELGQKLEPAHLAALATAARQDAELAVLNDILGLPFASTADMAELSTKLQQVIDNTADIALDADHLSIEADAINLNTDGVEGRLDTLNLKDFATQTTLAAVLAKISADPATQTTLAAVLAKLTSDPSTGAKQDTQATKLDTLHTDLGSVATQTTAAAILAKLSADPATQTTLEAIRVLLAAALTVKQSPASAVAGSNVPAAASSTLLMASNAARRGLLVDNNSPATLYLKYGTAPTATDYTVRIPSLGQWAMPDPVYTGQVRGIWTSASGFAMLSELT